MITNPFLRKIVKESCRREITTSMVVEAEKVEAEKVEWEGYVNNPYRHLAFLLQSQRALSSRKLAALQGQQAMRQIPAQNGVFGSLLGGALGGFFGNTAARCPCCGK